MTYSSKMNHFKGILITYTIIVSDTLQAGTTTQVVEASISQQQSYLELHSPAQSLFHLLIIWLKTSGSYRKVKYCKYRYLNWLSYLLYRHIEL